MRLRVDVCTCDSPQFLFRSSGSQQASLTYQVPSALREQQIRTWMHVLESSKLEPDYAYLFVALVRFVTRKVCHSHIRSRLHEYRVFNCAARLGRLLDRCYIS